MFKQGVVHALVTVVDHLSANPCVAASEVVFAHSGDKPLGRLDELSFSVRLVEFVLRHLDHLWVGDEPLKPLVSEGFDQLGEVKLGVPRRFTPEREHGIGTGDNFVVGAPGIVYPEEGQIGIQRRVYHRPTEVGLLGY